MNAPYATTENSAKERKNLLRLLKKGLLLALPFTLVMALYFTDDPFMVLHKYQRYDSPILLGDENIAGWQTYLNYRDSLHFDSFIMGNSNTMAFKTKEWEKYLKGGKAMRFFDNAETLDGIRKKLQGIEMVNGNIKNVLLIIDKETLHRYNSPSTFIHELPPAISHESEAAFQSKFLVAFFQPNILFPYIDYKIFHTYRPYMCGVINEHGSIKDPHTNDMHNPHDKEIEKMGEQYWVNNRDRFQPRSRLGKVSCSVLCWKDDLNELETISNIIRRHQGQVKVIISPGYKQIAINPADLKKLRNVFGASNVFDFSGVNEFTSDIHNYYEQGHYRPQVGARLLKIIYSRPEN